MIIAHLWRNFGLFRPRSRFDQVVKHNKAHILNLDVGEQD